MKACVKRGFSGGSAVYSAVYNESVYNAGDVGLIPELGISLEEGNRKPLYYCLVNPIDRGTWWASSWGPRRVGHDLVTKKWQHLKETKCLTTEKLVKR